MILILMKTWPNIVEIFYFEDEFCQEFNKSISGVQLTENTAAKSRNKPCKLSDAEVVTIIIEFHLGGYRHLKYFYTQYVQKHLQSEFPETVSYNRFVELQQKVLLPWCCSLRLCKWGVVKEYPLLILLPWEYVIMSVYSTTRCLRELRREGNPPWDTFSESSFIWWSWQGSNPNFCYNPWQRRW